jgi:hypothetical protein
VGKFVDRVVDNPQHLLFYTSCGLKIVIASVNTSQVLNDLTGSRRFLCFEALYIEIQEITENNEVFRIRPPEEDLFYTYFRQCEEDEVGSQWLTAAQIMGLLCLKTYLMMSSGGNIRLGILLRKEGVSCAEKEEQMSVSGNEDV